MRNRWLTLLLLGAGACGGDDSPDPGPTEPVDGNRAPTAVGEVPPVMLVAGQSINVDVSPFFRDPDGDPLTYQASSSDAAVVSVATSGSTLSINAVSAGAATLTVTATDPAGLSARQTANVTVANANQAPSPVGSIPAQTVTAGQTVTLDVSPFFTDPDGDNLRYEASTSDVSVVASSVSGSTLTIAGVSAGSATLTVTAIDPGDLSAEQAVNVTVSNPNQAPQPVGTMPDQTTSAGQTVTVELSLYFTDPDGDDLTYEASSSNPAVAAMSVSGSTLTIAGVAQGTAVITATATDPGGLSAQQTANVTVGERSRDREALVALYEATGGDFWWNEDTNWLSDRPLGTWFGVTTNDAGRVVELSLPGNRLWEGGIPGEIGLLSELRRLDLSDNNIHGALPAQIGDLAELVELNVEDNTFMGRDTGIPAALSKLQKLELLNLNDTYFEGEIPRELGNLSSLVRLELAEMIWMTGALPPEFGKLSNLEHLDVSNSAFDRALPQDLVKLTLKLFHWHGNRSTMCSPNNSEFQVWLTTISDHRGGRACR